jgi:hypothetical protein
VLAARRRLRVHIRLRRHAPRPATGRRPHPHQLLLAPPSFPLHPPQAPAPRRHARPAKRPTMTSPRAASTAPRDTSRTPPLGPAVGGGLGWGGLRVAWQLAAGTGGARPHSGRGVVGISDAGLGTAAQRGNTQGTPRQSATSAPTGLSRRQVRGPVQNLVRPAQTGLGGLQPPMPARPLTTFSPPCAAPSATPPVPPTPCLPQRRRRHNVHQVQRRQLRAARLHYLPRRLLLSDAVVLRWVDASCVCQQCAPAASGSGRAADAAADAS